MGRTATAEDDAHVERLLPILDEMLTGGALVTTEPVRVLEYVASDSARAPVPGGS